MSLPLLDTASAPNTMPPIRGRTLHLIDIENLVAGIVTPGNVRAIWKAYTDTVGIWPGDHTRVACAATTAVRVAFAIPPIGRQLLVGGRGPDAADLALIDSVDLTFTARRFDTVVIASADHGFAELAAALGERGCTVHAAHRGHCATALRLATSTQLHLPQLHHPRSR